MEKISEYDPLALTNIEFNIKSLKKYTSIATIIVSISVIVLSIAINISSIRQIWAPMEQLSIFYTKDKYSKQELSEDNLICFGSKQPFLFLPQLTITQKQQNRFIQKKLAAFTNLEDYSYMKKLIKEDNFYCFQLAGVSFREKGEKVNIELPHQNNGYKYQFYIREGSIKQILQNLQPQVRTFQIFANTDILYGVDFIEITLKDRLLLNYDPILIKKFNTDRNGNKYIIPNNFNSFNGRIIFQLKNNYDIYYEQNIQKYTIERQNIGQILSQVLAWRGLILIPIAFIFMFLPFVESFLKMDLIKARYTCPQLDSLEFSAWTDIKRKFANFCHLPKERVLNLAFDSIDNELDILQILRKQVSMKQRIGEVYYIEKPKDIFSCEFEHQQKADLLQIDNIGTCVNIGNTSQRKEFDFKEQQIEEGMSQKLKELTKFFDETETPVQVLSNGGKGYGSVWNIIALFMMSTGLICGLILMGLFEVSDKKTVNSWVPFEKQDFLIRVDRQKISFRPLLQQLFLVPSEWHFQGRVIDQNENTIQTIEIISGNECTIPSGQQSRIWFCLKTDAILNTQVGKKTTLVLNLKTSSTNRMDRMFLVMMSVDLYYYQKNYDAQNRDVEDYIRIRLASTSKTEFTLKKVVADQQQINIMQGTFYSNLFIFVSIVINLYNLIAKFNYSGFQQNKFIRQEIGKLQHYQNLAFSPKTWIIVLRKRQKYVCQHIKCFLLVATRQCLGVGYFKL